MKTNTRPIPWTIDRLLKATGGRLVSRGADCRFMSVSIDSRTIRSQDFFVAIKGPNHDGHTFIPDVLEKGVRGILINTASQADISVERLQDSGITCIAVDDTIQGLGDMASDQRKESGVKLIAITGSNGKTSTRAMTASVLNRKFNTHSTSGNFNNEIGLPLTLLELSESHEWAVVELGMNAPGEITRLGNICMPDIGIITNIGKAHLEGLGSLENIAAAKGELIDTLKSGGILILNGDDPMLIKLAKKHSTDVTFFGHSDDAAVKSDNEVPQKSSVLFDLLIGNRSVPVTLNTPGLFMVSNALAAAAAGTAAGLTPDDIKSGLEQFRPVAGRMNMLKSRKGYMVIDDTYNANPASMIEAVKTLKALKGSDRGILVTGDMLELGDGAENLHRDIGMFTASSGIDALFSTGIMAPCIADGALTGGMTKETVFTGTKKEIISSLSKHLTTSDWILVKGSRSMRMEDIVKALTEDA